jgi:hypothetical protein
MTLDSLCLGSSRSLFHLTDSSVFSKEPHFCTTTTTLVHRSMMQQYARKLQRKVVHAVEKHPVITAAAVGGTAVAGIGYYRYQAAIHQRLKEFQDSKIFGKDPFRMTRIPIGSMDPYYNKIQLVHICPEFKEKHKDKYQIYSLGEYLASLRPKLQPNNGKLPEWMEKELQATLVAALLKGLGPHVGAAVLPAALGVGAGGVHALAQGASQYLTERATLSKDSNGGLPISLFALVYIAELNYQRSKEHKALKLAQAGAAASGNLGGSDPTTPKATPVISMLPLERLSQGEVGYVPNFSTARLPAAVQSSGASTTNGNASTTVATSTVVETEPLVPQTFILSYHWKRAIDGMEELLIRQTDDQRREQQKELEASQAKSSTKSNTTSTPATPTNVPAPIPPYDPQSKAMAPPQPINERLLPGLHLGFGGPANECTHTHRQILQNRLLCVLLNKLASNYYLTFLDDSELKREHAPFIVKIHKDSPPITKPAELIEALIHMGHSVESCISSHVTTFGVGLSVLEDDGTWSNIPMACFLQSGFTDNNGQDAYAMLPHSGLNLEVRGPLLEKGSIQHYMSVEGVCAWGSNHYSVAPWIQDVYCGPVYRGRDVVRTVRVAALEAVLINGVASELELPFGGYGLTGVCNDSAAMIEYALTGQTHIYPITLGRFAMHNLRFAHMFRERLQHQGHNMKKEVDDLNALITAIKKLPSDLSTVPGNAEHQIERYLHLHSTDTPFSIIRESKKVVQDVKKSVQ